MKNKRASERSRFFYELGDLVEEHINPPWEQHKSNHFEQSLPIYPRPLDYKVFPGIQSS